MLSYATPAANRRLHRPRLVVPLRCQPSRGGAWTFKEEPNHLAAGIGTFGIRVRSHRTPARPSMTGHVKHPMLQHDTTAFVSVDTARVLEAACGVAAAYDGAELGSAPGL